jgi:hypothetical protein
MGDRAVGAAVGIYPMKRKLSPKLTGSKKIDALNFKVDRAARADRIQSFNNRNFGLSTPAALG